MIDVGFETECCCLQLQKKQMKKENLPLIIIVVSIILIIINFIFKPDEMDLWFWLRVVSSGLLILAMFLRIRDRKKDKNKSD